VDVPTEVQIFGRKKCADTRKAQRFFQERRIRVHFVDLAERGASLGELRRFAERFGVDRLIHRDGARFRERGLHVAHRSEAQWLDALVEDPGLLVTPLVRWKTKLTVGGDEAAWRGWTGR
jgi:arsenate reductase (glutaredoxin)